MTIRSVWRSGLSPAPMKNAGVALNGSNEKAISNNVRLMRCMNRRRQSWATPFASPGRGLRHNQATSAIHPNHIKSGPSRAAHVAANRYLSGKSSPPNAATCKMEVSLTRKRPARLTKGATIARCNAIESGAFSSCSRGFANNQHVAARANHIVSPHMVLG